MKRKENSATWWDVLFIAALVALGSFLHGCGRGNSPQAEPAQIADTKAAEPSEKPVEPKILGQWTVVGERPREGKEWEPWIGSRGPQRRLPDFESKTGKFRVAWQHDQAGRAFGNDFHVRMLRDGKWKQVCGAESYGYVNLAVRENQAGEWDFASTPGRHALVVTVYCRPLVTHFTVTELPADAAPTPPPRRGH